MIGIADAIMSYAVPVYLEDTLNSAFWMGMIMAVSSVVGFIADMVLGEWFGEKKYNFFLAWTLIIAFTMS